MLVVWLFIPLRGFPCDLRQARDVQLRTPVQLVGVYSNAKSNDGEHESGYTLEVWRDHDGLFGVFMVHGPLIGDPARGVISGVSYDPATHKLHFTAKLSISRGYSLTDQQGGVKKVPPSRDLLEFDGELTAEALKGAARLSSARAQEEPRETDVSLRLPRNRELEDSWQPLDLRARNCAEWVQRIQPILEHSGPMW